MTPSFKGKGDAMPPGDLWGTRTKYIHHVGCAAKVQFRPNGSSPYTGMFAAAEYGYIRLSSAAHPATSGLITQPLAPGMGLKWLRDGMDSANLVAMFSVNGQPNEWNFFKNNFWNHIGAADPGNLPL